jgi:hypothetical protein
MSHSRALLWFSLTAALGACTTLPVAQATDADSLGDGGVMPDSTGGDLARPTGALHYQADIQPIWEQYCGECHIDGPRRPRLTAALSYDSLVGATTQSCADGRPEATLVVPGHPEQSYLAHSIGDETSFGPDSACDARMPYMKTVLMKQDPAAVEKIRRWIAEGATRD